MKVNSVFRSVAVGTYNTKVNGFLILSLSSGYAHKNLSWLREVHTGGLHNLFLKLWF